MSPGRSGGGGGRGCEREESSAATTAIDLTRFLLQARGWRGQVGRVSEQQQQQLCSPVELVNEGSKGPRRDPAIGPGMVFCTRTAVGVHWLL